MKIVVVGRQSEIVRDTCRGSLLISVVSADDADDVSEASYKVFAEYEPRRTKMRETNVLPQFMEFFQPIVHPSTRYRGPVGGFSIVGKNCVIDDTAKIADNCVIGNNVVIEEHVVIADHCSIHDNVVIKAGSYIGSYTIVEPNATVAGSTGIFVTIKAKSNFSGTIDSFEMFPAPSRRRSAPMDHALLLSRNIGIVKNYCYFAVNEHNAFTIAKSLAMIKFERQPFYVLTDFASRSLAKTFAPCYVVPHFYWWDAMAMHYQQMAPIDKTVFVMKIGFGNFDPLKIKYYIDNCRYRVLLDATNATLGNVYEKILDLCPNLIACVVSFREGLPWGSKTTLAGCIVRPEDSKLLHDIVRHFKHEYCATPSMIRSASDSMIHYIDNTVKKQTKLQREIRELLKTKQHVQLYTIKCKDKETPDPITTDIWSHVAVTTQYPMPDKLIEDIGSDLDYLPIMKRTNRTKFCYNKHVAILPMDASALRKIDAIDHFMKMRHASIENAPNLGVTWYVMMATYQRSENRTPAMIREVVESYKASAAKSKSTIRFVIVGDCYEDREEFDRLMTEMSIDFYHNLDEPGERGRMPSRRQMWRSQGSTAWNRAIDIIEDFESSNDDPNIWVVHADDDDPVTIDFFTEHEAALKEPYISEDVLVDHLYTNFENAADSFGVDGHPNMRFVDVPMVTCVHPRGAWRLKGIMAKFRYDNTKKVAGDAQFTIEITKRAAGTIRSRLVNKGLYCYKPATDVTREEEDDDPDEPYRVTIADECEIFGL